MNYKHSRAFHDAPCYCGANDKPAPFHDGSCPRGAPEIVDAEERLTFDLNTNAKLMVLDAVVQVVLAIRKFARRALARAQDLEDHAAALRYDIKRDARGKQ